MHIDMHVRIRKRQKLVFQELQRVLHRVWSIEVREVRAERFAPIHELVLKQVHFVEKQNICHFLPEVFVVDDICSPDIHRILQTVDAGIFIEKLVKLAHANNKYYGGHVIEASNPLTALVTLPTHVDELELDATDVYRFLRLDDSGCLNSDAKIVVRGRQIVCGADAVRMCKEISCALCPELHRGLMGGVVVPFPVRSLDDGFVSPQMIDILQDGTPVLRIYEAR
jgi:hypothetical protein